MRAGAVVEPVATSRERLLRRGVGLALVTVGWNVGEGVIALLAGAAANSVALLAFGMDSFVETASGAVVGWRLWVEWRGGAGREPARIERVERGTARVAGALLLLLAVYVAVDGSRRLLGDGEPSRESPVGIALVVASLIAMPLLARAKLRIARALGSGALRADAYETLACAWLSLTTLSGLVLTATLGWTWADPLAALALVPLLVREARAALRGECCG